jgi:hypothetical protein
MRIPNSFDFRCLAFARLRRHCHANDGKWVTTGVSKLEVPTGVGRTTLIEAVHVPARLLPKSQGDVPDLHHSAVSVRMRNVPSSQFEVSQTASIRPHE